jgi:hypothetical protein
LKNAAISFSFFFSFFSVILLILVRGENSVIVTGNWVASYLINGGYQLVPNYPNR